MGDITTGLVGHWTFDEGTGTTANDSANTNHAALTDVSWVAGKVGGAGSFDGTTSRGDAPHNATLQMTDEVTLALWMYPTAVGQSSYSVLAGKGDGNGHTYSLRWSADRTIRSDLAGDPNYSLIETTATLPLDEWHHVVMTWNRLASGNNRFIYFNGVEVFAGSFTEALSATKNETDRFVLGSPFAEESRPNRRFAGYLDEVRVYNRALSATDVVALYHHPIAVLQNYYSQMQG